MAEEKKSKTVASPGEIFKEIFIAGLMAGLLDGLREWLKSNGQQAGQEIGKKAYKRLIEEKRSELLAFLHNELEAQDPVAAKNIFRRQQARQNCEKRTYGNGEEYLPGDEDKMIFLLAKLYMAMECIDGEDKTCADKKKCTEIFKWMGNLSDEEFDSKLEFLNHDSVTQLLKRMKIHVHQTAKAVIENPYVRTAATLTLTTATTAFMKVNSFAGNIATELQPVSDRLEAELRKSKKITREKGLKGVIRRCFDF
ncbi:MAG: hypothetical protein WC461_01335 [Candidatus Paceibacterota bacterium]